MDEAAVGVSGAGRLVQELSLLRARLGVIVPDVCVRMDLTSGDILPLVGDEGGIESVSNVLLTSSSNARNESTSCEDATAENKVSVLENTLCVSVVVISLPCVPADPLYLSPFNTNNRRLTFRPDRHTLCSEFQHNFAYSRRFNQLERQQSPQHCRP